MRVALFNVIKHAQTLDATVRVEKANDHIQISVSDGGVGFSADFGDLKNDVGGLANIQSRVNLMGCNLSVQSQPGKGTQVIIQVPA